MNINWDIVLFYSGCIIGGLGLGKAFAELDLLAIITFIVLFIILFFIRNEQTKKIKLTNVNSKTQGLISRIHDFILDLDLVYTCWKYDLKEKLKYRFLCKHGYHQTFQCMRAVSGYGYKREIKIEFLKCGNCRKMFFANLKDKEKFLKHFARQGDYK